MLPANVAAYTKSPVATGADITSESIHRCHATAPVFRSNATRTWLAEGGCPSTPLAGYDANTRPFAMAGELVSGSPSQCDQSSSPLFASTAKMVHDSVPNTQISSSHAGLDGPSSSNPRPQTA